jgi:hypothetical protein
MNERWKPFSAASINSMLGKCCGIPKGSCPAALSFGVGGTLEVDHARAPAEDYNLSELADAGKVRIGGESPSFGPVRALMRSSTR